MSISQRVNKLLALGTGLLKVTSGVLGLAVPDSDYLEPDGDGSGLTGLTQSQVSGLTTADSPTFAGVRFPGEAAAIIGVQRNSTAASAGNNLSINGGAATSASTDKDGGYCQVSPGQSTGTGKASVRLNRYGRAATTGTGNNTIYNAILVPSVKNLTNNTDTGLFTLSLANGSCAGGRIEWTVECTDGTDFQSYSGITTLAAVNKGGSVTTTITQNASNDAKAVSAGTITTTWSITGTTTLTIKVNANSSLTPTALRIFYAYHNGAQQTWIQL